MSLGENPKKKAQQVRQKIKGAGRKKGRKGHVMERRNGRRKRGEGRRMRECVRRKVISRTKVRT